MSSNIEAPKPWKPWTPEQLETLQRMGAAQDRDWDDISAACGHSAGSCSTTLNKLLRRIADGRGIAFGKADPRNPKRYWCAADVVELKRLCTVEQRTFPEIDKALGRPPGASAWKFRSLRDLPPAGVILTRAIHAPKYVPAHKSLTAAFFGDPLPGRSALDQRQKPPSP